MLTRGKASGGGGFLATVLLDLAAVIVSSITPQLDTDAEHQRLVTTKPCAHFCFAVLKLWTFAMIALRLPRRNMVATAVSR